MAKRPVPKKLAKKLYQIRVKLGLSQTEMVRGLNYKASPLRAAQISTVRDWQARAAFDAVARLREAGENLDRFFN